MTHPVRSFSDWLDDMALRSGQAFSRSQHQQLVDYVNLLREWNEKINLTAVLDDEGIAVRHLLDSLTLLPILDGLAAAKGSAASMRFVDVGTGAGLPGLVLKIMRPDWEGVLMDALAKRLHFIDAVVARLNLTGLVTWHSRAEDAGRLRDMREQFDLSVARAVAPLAVLAEYCLPFTRVGGLFVAMKGRPENEWPQAARAVSLLGGELEDLQQFVLPGTDMQRSLFCIRKISPVPKHYPRRAGRPEKQPL